MSVIPGARARFGLGLAIGFALGVFVTFAGLLGFGMWAARQAQDRAAPLAPPALPAPGQVTALGRFSYRGELRDLQGRRLALAALRHRVLVIHLWATWCPPCVEELPRLEALCDSLAPHGVAVLAVSEESRERVAAFAARRGLRLPLFVAASTLPAELRPDAVPTTLVVRRDGIIVARQVGAAAWDGAAARCFLLGLR